MISTPCGTCRAQCKVRTKIHEELEYPLCLGELQGCLQEWTEARVDRLTIHSRLKEEIGTVHVPLHIRFRLLEYIL